MLSREQLEDAKECKNIECANCKMIVEGEREIDIFSCQERIVDTALGLMDKVEMYKSLIRDMIAEIDIVEMAEETGISDELYVRLKEAVKSV